MYKRHLNQINLLDEPEYFGGIALDPDNEWVKLAKLIPWHRQLLFIVLPVHEITP